MAKRKTSMHDPWFSAASRRAVNIHGSGRSGLLWKTLAPWCCLGLLGGLLWKVWLIHVITSVMLVCSEIAHVRI